MAGLTDIRNELAELLKALGHPDRVRLVEELNGSEKDVQTLSDTLGVRQARVSQHLAVLRASNVVEDRRDGRHVLYRLAKPTLAAWIILGGATLVDARPELGEDLNTPDEIRLVLEEESEEKDEKNRKKQ
ncbi:MAG: metalloregulator ArsR/SmtB family transcription factor [Bryobacterales bacterium]